MNTAINFGAPSATPSGPALASALRGPSGIQSSAGVANPMAGMLLSRALDYNKNNPNTGWGDKLGSLFSPDKPTGAAQYNVSPEQYQTYHTQANGPNVSLPYGQIGQLFGGGATDYGGMAAVPAGMEIPAGYTAGGLSTGAGVGAGAGLDAGAAGAGDMAALYGMDSAAMYGAGAEGAGDLAALYGAGAGAGAAGGAAAAYGAGAAGGTAAAAGTAEAGDAAYLAALAAMAA